MSGRGLFHVRSTRLVAGARAVLAAFLALGVLFNSLAHSLEVDLVRPLILGYLGYALVLLGISRSRRFGYRLLRRPLAPTVVDVAVFTALFYMTTAAESPFFSPLVFLIVSATIQWGSRGALGMSAVILAIFTPAAAMAIVGDESSADGALTSIVRLGYILVVTVLLFGFGRHFERMTEELTRLAAPVGGPGMGVGPGVRGQGPSSLGGGGAADAEPPLGDALAHTLALFRTRRGVALWSEADEPYLNVVEQDGEAQAKRVLAPGGDEWLVKPELEGAVFLYDRASDLAITRRGSRSAMVRGAPIAPELLATLAFERMLVIPLKAEPIEGVLLVMDQDEPATEDLAFGSMVSAQVSTLLQRWQAQMTHRAAAAAAERVRLARDLHDGVLQFLAGAALQLETLLRAGNLPVATKVRLMGLRQALGDEQRELRAFINAMRPARPHERGGVLSLAEDLEDLTDHLSRYWNISVLSEVSGDLNVPAETAYDIGRIVREAVANAVRHGRARNVMVTARQAANGLSLEISDDGRGFAFHGRKADEDLTREGLGPRSLQERAHAMGGRIWLDSGPKGARLGIELPLQRLAA